MKVDGKGSLDFSRRGQENTAEMKILNDVQSGRDPLLALSACRFKPVKRKSGNLV